MDEFVKEGDLVILVTPIDKEAPKGRLILPQQQVLRDILNNGSMALRQIMNYLDDEVLRKKSKPVDNINKKILTLINDMVGTMYASKGVGLAAPQVGILKRIIVVDIGEGIIKLINPRITKRKGKQQNLEGYVSVPEITGEVERPEKVIIKALNENGDSIELEGTGLLARAFCHEVDHLDGILFIDKIVPGTKNNL